MADRSAILTALRATIALSLLVGLSYAADWMLRVENFPVQNVRFEGPFKRVTQRELETAMMDLVRGNFFLVDLDAIQQRVEALPWVHQAVVRRSFPHDISIQFTEERLVAHWSDSAWVNATGEIVRVSAPDLPADLPKLAGPDETSAQVLSAYQEFREALTPLGLKVTGLTLTPRRSWRIEIDGGEAQPLTVLLDHEQPRIRLERFARVYSSALAMQAQAIRQIDLRYTNGFAVEWQNRAGRPQVAHTVAARNEG